jgi:hypothetical protein
VRLSAISPGVTALRRNVVVPPASGRGRLYCLARDRDAGQVELTVAEGHPSADDWLATVCAGSEMGALVREKDWAGTSLGPPDAWPRVLRTAVSICLTSRFPMLVVWGPELIEIYNDGYRPILGSEKHPGALGAPTKEIWAEIWDEISLDFEQVMQTGVPTWHEHEKLVLERNGFPEECYFTWSYSPLFDEDGTIAGVLNTVRETTEMVIARRRLRCIIDVSASLVGASQVTDVCLRATGALRSRPEDIPAVDMYLRIGDQLPLVASSRRGQMPPVSAELIDA